MASQLYKDYSTRMESLAPSLSICTRVQAARKYSEYDLLLLVMSVILFIYDGMMESEYRSPEEITEHLRDLVRQTYKTFLTEDEAVELANYILYDILQKEGAEGTFVYTLPENGSKKSVAVQIIAMHTFTADGRVTYKLSSQGLRFLYSTREFEQEIEITIQLFYIRQHIKNRKYEPALKGLNDTILLLSSVVAQFDEFEARCRADALSIGANELELLKTRALSNFYEEKDQFENLTKMVREGLAEIEKEGLMVANLDEEARRQLRGIEGKLRTATEMHQTLLNRKTRAEMAYHEAVQNRIARGVLKQIHFVKDVLDPLIHADAYLAEACLGLHYLFFHPRKQFNPVMKILSPPKLRAEPTARSETVILDEIVDYSAYERKREFINRQVERYRHYLVGFLACLGEKTCVKTSEYIAGLTAEARSEVIRDPFLVAFLLDFHQVGVLRLDNLEREAEGHIRVEEEEIDVLWLLLDVIKVYPKLVEHRYLVVRAPVDIYIEVGDLGLSDFCFFHTDDLEEVLLFD